MRRLFFSAVVLGLTLAPTPVAAGAQARPRVADLEARVEEGRARVSFRLENGFSEDTLERIHSGIPVVFRHRIEIERGRTFPLPDKLLARAIVETRVEYDLLTRRYALSRTVELRSRDKKRTPPPETREAATDSPEEMRAWMTSLDEIDVHDPARAIEGRNVRVRVNSVVGRHYVLWIFPARVSASAERRMEG